MSSSDGKENSGHRPRRTFPFHDAAEKGDIEALQFLIERKKLALSSHVLQESNQLPQSDVSKEAESDNVSTTNEIEKIDPKNAKEENFEKEDSSDGEDEIFSPGMNLHSNSSSDSEQSESETKESSYSYLDYNLISDADELDNDNCTALHISILNQQLECVKMLLEFGSNSMMRCEGSSVLHLAVAQSAFNQDFSLNALKLLLESTTVEAGIKDDRGQTLLHLAINCENPAVTLYILALPEAKSILECREPRQWRRALHFAAEAENPELLQILISAHQKFDVSLSHPSDIMGRTPLHLACNRGRWKNAELLLNCQQSLFDIKDKFGLTAGDLASRMSGGNLTNVPSNLKTKLGLKESESTNEMDSSTEMQDSYKPTAIFYHKTCEQHYTCNPIGRAGPEPPPENISRLKVIYNKENGVLKAKKFSDLEWCDSSQRAHIGDILRVHDYSYVEKVRKVCQRIEAAPSKIANLDGDTAVSHLSYDAALRAAGAVIEAVDRVCSGYNRNAFCAVRPPGHHAGFRGKTILSENEKDGSHGFCLLNNVVIGAAYARSMYRNQGIQRIAIVDFDVHHGNGTEDCVKNLIPSIEEMAISIPFTQGVLRRMKYQPWLNEGDAKHVLFVSSHGYGKNHWSIPEDHPGGWFYPGSGKSCTPESSLIPPERGDQNEIYERDVSDIDARRTSPLILNLGMPLHRRGVSPGLSRHELRMAYRNDVFPRINEFKPDLILVSAGFDAHHKDLINFGYIGLYEEDYYWITEQLVQLANNHCEGRIISVLEGGYRIQGGPVSAFGRSVANHVEALMHGCRNRCQWDAHLSALQSEVESKQYAEREAKRQQKRLLEREQQIAALHQHQTSLAAAVAASSQQEKANSTDLGFNSLETQRDLASRTKRKRVPVDYVALSKKLNEEEKSSV
mmetsp:Transcript_1042/g.1348  ORF Transcript_1042/g.1348 Transcript_1042/m.1348 type:complete len:909 (+) Transcript_1042:110-2836(+)|eukprot:CAMPEP_0117758310 /NCGR_PEP_ID=MMETSP0947-20121206/15295_1 /TAXON_ID=44440 /ORGANISM="Chattonella subsalsa, Strain CCMP2191" /LENGTH=908 /DNA_ID=CAMNT_0005578459 /DNA_START=46 /DNA_END=2772 /DNA_ORIENTATION=-